MAGSDETGWDRANHDYLAALLAELRTLLELRAAQGEPQPADQKRAISRARQQVRAAAKALPSTAAIDDLCGILALSDFERNLLLLCAGVELDARFAAACAAAQGAPDRLHATFSVALAALASPDWEALSPAAPLRYWKLIEVGAGAALTQSPLRIDERILQYLLGADYLDDRIRALVEPIAPDAEMIAETAGPHGGIVEALARAMVSENPPVAQLTAARGEMWRAIAWAACDHAGLDLQTIPVHALPVAAADLNVLVRLWNREAMLSGRALLIDGEDMDEMDKGAMRAMAAMARNAAGAVIIGRRERGPLAGRPSIVFEIPQASAAAQRAAWLERLPENPDRSAEIERIVAHFQLDFSSIRAICASLGPEPDGAAIWKACREQARRRLDEMAQRIDASAGWDDLVLPAGQMSILREIAAQVHNRAKVYGEWGFAPHGARGAGIAALFAGVSGTGKTLAAEVLANELKLDLFRIDLSAVMSKWIGETEKNLRRIFDAAEESGAVLLFDEADALFGKRSEVKDSHDRHANIEVSYLLQKMEAFGGLAILTTNLKQALDAAFLRRLRFVVNFPFPDAEQRAQIWRRVFPAGAPASGLDFEKLAALNIAGGAIRNIAIRAAFRAAEENSPILMRHVASAARAECAKMERPLLESELAGWE